MQLICSNEVVAILSVVYLLECLAGVKYEALYSLLRRESATGTALGPQVYAGVEACASQRISSC